MNENIFRFLVIPLAILLAMGLGQSLRKRFARSKSKDGAQTVGKFDSCLLKFIIGLMIFNAVIGILGLLAGEIEMGTVFSVVALVFLGVVLLLKREYNITYEENEEFFHLKTKGKEYVVRYENIVDWIPSNNEILIFDETTSNQKPIKVNVAMIQPEILLRNIIEMTFAGKFVNFEEIYPNDPQRKIELKEFLNRYNYEYLVKEYYKNKIES